MNSRTHLMKTFIARVCPLPSARTRITLT